MNNPLDMISSASEVRPKAVIGIIILITIALGMGIPLISQEVDMESYLPEDNESLAATKTLSEIYGSQTFESILVRGDIASMEGMAALRQLQLEIMSEPGFDAYVDSVSTYLDYLYGAGLIGEEINEQTAMAVQQILAADSVSDSPQFIGRLISEDMQNTLVFVQVVGHTGEPGVDENTAKLISIVKGFSDSDNGLTAGITGDNSVGLDMMEAMNRDNRVLASLAIVFILFILYFIFRNISDTLFPYLTIAIAMIWILGIMGYTGVPFTMALVSLVPLLLGICINYAIHIMFRYREERRNEMEVGEAIKACVTNTGTAVFISALTTAIGFSSFLFSELMPMRDFGFLAILGIIFAFFLVVTLLPALTVLRDSKKKVSDASRFAVLGGGVSNALEGIVRVGINHKRPLLICTLLITILSLGLSSQVGSALNWNDMAPEDIESMRTAREIESLFENSMNEQVFILVQGDIYSPEVISEVLAIEARIRQLDILNSEGEPIITSEFSVGSYADILVQANNGVIPTSSEESKGIATALISNPQTASLISQYLIFNPLSKYYNTLSLINIETNVVTDTDIEAAVDKIEGFYEETSFASYRSAGVLVIMTDIMGGMMDTQIRTTIVALILCFFAVSLIMRSPLYGFLAVLTVGLAITWEFLLLYLMGWQFDLFTIMISAMIVGLGIDFSVHIIERFREEIAQGRGTEEALHLTIVNVGKALLTSTITTSGAFFIISMSLLPMVYRFGILSGMVLIFSFVVAMFVLPPVMAWANNRKAGGTFKAP